MGEIFQLILMALLCVWGGRIAWFFTRLLFTKLSRDNISLLSEILTEKIHLIALAATVYAVLPWYFRKKEDD